MLFWKLVWDSTPASCNFGVWCAAGTLQLGPYQTAITMNHISYENANELGLESSQYPMKGFPWPLKIAE